MNSRNGPEAQEEATENLLTSVMDWKVVSAPGFLAQQEKSDYRYTNIFKTNATQ